MTGLAVITPTWRPDAQLFEDLHRSVLEYTSDDTVHHVIVPAAHRDAFARYAGRRCRIWTHPELLPRRYVRFPPGIWLNAKRPWPPVRGWVMQQAAKIAASAIIDADVTLIADSDSVLIRPTTAQKLSMDGTPRPYRAEEAVHAEMPRHLLWHEVARRLLGIAPAPPPPLPDYVNAIAVWDQRIVRAMQARIAEVTGRHWVDAFTSELHISEFMVYGVFVDEVLDSGQGTPVKRDDRLCHSYYGRTPLDIEAALEFAEELEPDDIGMMISGNSDTPRHVRHAAIRRAAEIVSRS